MINLHNTSLNSKLAIKKKINNPNHPAFSKHTIWFCPKFSIKKIDGLLQLMIKTKGNKMIKIKNNLHLKAEKFLLTGSLEEFKIAFLDAGNLDCKAVTVAGEEAATEEPATVLLTNRLFVWLLAVKRGYTGKDNKELKKKKKATKITIINIDFQFKWYALINNT